MTSTILRLVASLFANDPNVRSQAAERLAQLGPKARPAAMSLVLACGDVDEKVKKSAASALEKIGPPDAADRGQLAAFLKGRSPEVGYWAATLLGWLKSEAAPVVDALVHAKINSPHPLVRQRAAWALGEIEATPAVTLP